MGAILLLLVPAEMRDAVLNAWVNNYFVFILGLGTCFVLIVFAMDTFLRGINEDNEQRYKRIANWAANIFVRLSDGPAISIHYRAMCLLGLNRGKTVANAIQDSTRLREALEFTEFILDVSDDPVSVESLVVNSRVNLRHTADEAMTQRRSIKGAEDLSVEALLQGIHFDGFLYNGHEQRQK